MEFIQAAQAFGFSDLRVMLRHMLPNATGPITVIAAANFAAAILIESGLSFLGYGAQIPIRVGATSSKNTTTSSPAATPGWLSLPEC